MNVLEQFGVELSGRVIRGRGAYLCETNQGIKLLREVFCAEEKFAKEDFITKEMKKSGYHAIDTFMRTTEGSLLAEDEEHKIYYLKDWFDANECDVRDYYKVMKSVGEVAKMHVALERVDVSQKEELHIPAAENKSEYYIRKCKEMQSLRNYLKKKKQKSDFERTIYVTMEPYLCEARKTMDSVQAMTYQSCYDTALASKQLCHGDCNYHNVLVNTELCAVVSFNRVQIHMAIVDLYDYMRKILEKYEWDIKLAYKMFDEYNRIRTISEKEFQILAYLFAFPEKYFKILDHYYNGSKYWLPDKDVEKLKIAICQNEARMRFVSTLK